MHIHRTYLCRACNDEGFFGMGAEPLWRGGTCLKDLTPTKVRSLPTLAVLVLRRLPLHLSGHVT